MNRFKQAITSGQAQIGLWQSLANAYTAEICAGAGFDWLLIDGEHAPNDIPLILTQLQATAAYPVEAVVRMPVGERTLTKLLLDIGARSLLVPMVESRAQAEALVRATRYPPRGERGVGYGVARASAFGRIADYPETCEDDICLLLQVENRAGIAALEAIASTEGVDGVFIGPADLAAALGHIGNPGHPDVLKVVESAILAVIAQGKAAGVLTASEPLAHRYLELGATFVAVGADVSILSRGTEELARKFKQPQAAPAARPSSPRVY